MASLSNSARLESWDIVEWIRKLDVAPNGDPLTPPERHIALLLATHFNRDRQGAWPGYGTLAEESGWSERQVKAVMAELVRKRVVGKIGRKKGHGGNDSNLYNFPARQWGERGALQGVHVLHQWGEPGAPGGEGPAPQGVNVVHQGGAGPSPKQARNHQVEPEEGTTSRRGRRTGSADAPGDAPPLPLNGHANGRSATATAPTLSVLVRSVSDSPPSPEPRALQTKSPTSHVDVERTIDWGDYQLDVAGLAREFLYAWDASSRKIEPPLWSGDGTECGDTPLPVTMFVIDESFRCSNKIEAIAAELHIKVRDVRELVARLWSWAVWHSNDDGMIWGESGYGFLDHGELVQITGWTGDPDALDAALFRWKLLDVTYERESDYGELFIPGWEFDAETGLLEISSQWQVVL